MTSVILKNRGRWVFFLAANMALVPLAPAFTPSQQPPENAPVPGNVVLALSVEFPTGLQASYTTTTYTASTQYDGYFDNRKCYTYDNTNEVFKPVSAENLATGACPLIATKATAWSGNLLNWLTMTNIDQFRSVMTGGTRDSFSSMSATYPGDTTARTVLIRSFSDRDSYNPIKNFTPSSTIGVGGINSTTTLPTTTIKYARSSGYGSKMIVSNASNFGTMSAAQQKLSCAATPATTMSSGSAGTFWCFNLRVEACVAVPVGAATPDVGLEANCQNSYSGVPKPEGLIQNYSKTLRFAALGYLNLTGQSLNGGVLRSAMKNVSPVLPSALANAAKEWDPADGTMIANPDPTDATNSGVTQSGLMNYVNKFGYDAGYKGNDPVSELYYAALLYLRGKAPPAEYSVNNNPTVAEKDGFPVITGTDLLAGGARDPLINSCQKNFILGIGDINTHCDGNLPGSTKNNTGTCGSSIPTDNINVQTLWSSVVALEPGLTDTNWVGGSTYGTPYMAGLAYWANTNDIRPDATTTDPNSRGKQTVATYWVDVLENMNGQSTVLAASKVKSQYWLATKYGGFRQDLATSNNPNTNIASWDAKNRGIPDTWFAGSTPGTMKAGLAAAFSDIASRAGTTSASSAAVTSNRQTSSSQNLYAGYIPRGWMGTVSACSPTKTATECATAPTWEASRWFKTTIPTWVDTPLLPTTRKIFTSSPDTPFTSMPLQWASLNAAQKLILNDADNQGAARVSYYRGDRTNENGLFRKREDTLLGDIVNSGITYLSGPGPLYSGPNFPGHAAYRTSNETRPAVVYVGANDGMLHAFSGTNGQELFGYVPGPVFANLPALTVLNFAHKFFVDSTPMVGDIQKSDSTWGTVLVGGLGAGGKGYYGLDITSQSTFATATESTLSTTLPLWAFTATQDDDLGFTFNEAALDPVYGSNVQIAKVADSTTASGAWRVIVGNGFGSTAGRAALFMLDATTGITSTKLMADNAGPSNGLAAPRPVDTDKDGLIDTVYAGDMLGNMHKFQFSKLVGSNYVLAASGSTDGAWRYIGKIFSTGEPITTAPSVVPACDGNGWDVLFGTGKLNEDADYSSTAARGFYAVVDNNPSSSLTVAASSIATITPTASTSGTTTTRSWTAPNLTGKQGWKMAFTDGERVLSNSTLPPDTGTVLFSTTKPTGDICTPGNTGYIMAVNLCTGKIGDMVVNGTLVGGVSLNSTGVIKVSNTYTDSAGKEKILCNQDDCKDPSGPSLLPKIPPRGRYSWRELLSK
jgi:type IV pilus assembly protein PilY1